MKEEKKATRQSYGEALLELGKKNKEIVVFDADGLFPPLFFFPIFPISYLSKLDTKTLESSLKVVTISFSNFESISATSYPSLCPPKSFRL